MTNKRIRSMSIDAMFLAIMIIMTFVPNLGFISITPFLSLTLIHIIVLIGAVHGGWRKGLLYGMMFGLLSLLKAATSPVSFLDPFFVNPLISVLPRMIFGLLSGIFFDLIKRLKSNTLKVILLPVTSFAMTFIHSIMVLSMLGAFVGSTLEMNGETIAYWSLMAVTLGESSLAEAIAAAVVVLPVTMALLPNMISLSKAKDISVPLGIVGLCLAPVLPFVTWVVSGIGLNQASIFINDEGRFMNRVALITSFVIAAAMLITYMIVFNG